MVSGASGSGEIRGNGGTGGTGGRKLLWRCCGETRGTRSRQLLRRLGRQDRPARRRRMLRAGNLYAGTTRRSDRLLRGRARKYACRIKHGALLRQSNRDRITPRW